jgi:hypothetical protein
VDGAELLGRLGCFEVALEILVGLVDFRLQLEVGRLVLPAARSFLHVRADFFLEHLPFRLFSCQLISLLVTVREQRRQFWLM